VCCHSRPIKGSIEHYFSSLSIFSISTGKGGKITQQPISYCEKHDMNINFGVLMDLYMTTCCIQHFAFWNSSVYQQERFNCFKFSTFPPGYNNSMRKNGKFETN